MKSQLTCVKRILMLPQSADNLMHLCRFYNIQNVLAAFGYLPSGTELPSLSNQEYKLIEAYRNHPDMQPAIDKLLDLNTAETPEKPETETYDADNVHNSVS